MKYLSIALFLFISIKTFGQEIERKKHYGVWTFHQKNTTTNGVSLGLASFNDTMNNYTNGLKIELIGLGLLIPLAPQNPNEKLNIDSLMKTPISEKINGLVMSGSGTICDCITNGMVVGIIGHSNRKINGVSIALLMNFVKENNGLQISAFNDSYYMNGLQIGLVNKSQKLKGIQIGLWNVNQKREMPLFNWNFGM